MKSVNLSSGVLLNPVQEKSTYVNYGAAISEVHQRSTFGIIGRHVTSSLLQVEVDLLTGATTILRSDLVYDGGKSLNPAVDLGQV